MSLNYLKDELSKIKCVLSNLLHLLFVKSIFEYFEDDLDCKIDNLNSTDDGEPSEESHGSSNS